MLRWIMIAVALLSALPTEAAAPPEVIVQYLETIAGASFTPQEAARIVAVERRLAVRDVAARRKTWTSAAAFVRQYRGAKLEEQAYLRHRARAAFQLATQPDPTALAIVVAHDPVVLTDPGRKEAVTAADLRAVQASNDFVSRMTGVAPPPPGSRQRTSRARGPPIAAARWDAWC